MDSSQSVGSWRELGSHFGTAVVLAGGVLVGAVNVYLAASLLPTAVADIGGGRLYAWNMTVFLIAQVVATMLVSRTLARIGSIGSYLLGFGVFAAGSVLCAASPAMPVLLVGRGVQGLGAGLLTGLGFALIHSALPRHLWVRGSALISAMFGLGNFVGPALGGIFAQFGSWRLAFVVLALASVMLAALAPKALPSRSRSRSRTERETAPVAMRSLLLVIGAVGVVSIAGILSNTLAMAILLALALVLIWAFVRVEKRMSVRVLPSLTYRAGSALRWVYLTIALLASGVAVETFLPLFSQRLGGLPPVAAGFFGAALSLGWSVTQVVSSSARREQTVRWQQVAGPGLLAAGLAVLALLQYRGASLLVVIVWLPVLLIAGAGIGLAMPHLSVAAMASTTDKQEGEKAAAAIATVLTTSTAFGAALAGLLVNVGGPSSVSSARWLLLGFALLSALGMLTALRADGSGTHVAQGRSESEMESTAGP
ncbi:MFS transporter [Streptomyces sp. NPDC001922]|uniref:MFS transporter n=1 Tax=Streptomyces sp. NPDC001922 TaxID=3364624 RepID=UPI0036B19259